MPTDPALLLKDIRDRLELTQRALAQKLGVTPRTIHRWETGGSVVTDGVLPRAISLLRAKDPTAADRLSVELGLPAAREQEQARRIALDHAVLAVADWLDVSPRRARGVLTLFLTHVIAGGMTATDARSRLLQKQGELDQIDEASIRAAQRGLVAVEARRRYKRARTPAGAVDVAGNSE